MSLSDRRRFLAAGVALAVLGACNFTPVYAPGGAGSKLDGRVLVDAPNNRQEYQVVRRLEERLGRADPAPMTLSYSVNYSSAALGATSTGSTTRQQRHGTLSYTLKNSETGATIDSGTVSGFTGNSATGNTAASLAAERAAIERLMILLADKLVDRLHLIDPALLP